MKKLITMMVAFSITLMIGAIYGQQEPNPQPVIEEHIIAPAYKPGPKSKNKKIKKSIKVKKQTRQHPMQKRYQPQRIK